MKRTAVLIGLLGCNGAVDPGVGGAGGTTAADSSSSVPVTVSSGASMSSSSVASSSSTGPCVPIACPAGACGEYPNGCGGTSPCVTICDVGDECGPSNACVTCQTPATCASCFPSGAKQQADCEALPLPHMGCQPTQSGLGVPCGGPNTSVTFPVQCNWDPGQESCAVDPNTYCRDVVQGTPCPGSKAPPN